MKRVLGYLKAKPARWIPVLGIPVLLIIFYGAQHDGFQWSDIIGTGIFALGFVMIGGAARIYGMETSTIVAWPLRRSLLVFGGSMYLSLIGSEVARGDFELVDLVIVAIISLMWASFLVWKIKRDFYPVPPPVISE